MGSCVEPLFDGVVQWSCVILELVGLLMVSQWVVSCDIATAHGGGKALLTATFHLVPVRRKVQGKVFGWWGLQHAEGAPLAVCTECCCPRGHRSGAALHIQDSLYGHSGTEDCPRTGLEVISARK